MQIVNRDKTFPKFIFLLKKLLCLRTVGFCDQGALWSSSCDELKNFAANTLLKLVIKSRTGIRALKGEIVTTEQVQLGIGVKVQL